MQLFFKIEEEINEQFFFQFFFGVIFLQTINDPISLIFILLLK